MLREILEQKYGTYITDKLMTLDNEIIIDNINESGKEQQSAVSEVLENIRRLDIDKKLPEHFWNNEIEWGVVFDRFV